MRAGDDMPRGERRARRPRRTGRGRILLVVVAIGLFILITTLRSIASFSTDYLWFQSIGQTGVWRGVLVTKLMLAVVFIAAFFVLMRGGVFGVALNSFLIREAGVLRLAQHLIDGAHAGEDARQGAIQPRRLAQLGERLAHNGRGISPKRVLWRVRVFI